MRVDRLDLIAYGCHRDTSVDLSRPEAGLTLVWGPNEAGKSTAMRALLAALFGFSASAQDAYVFGKAGLRIGAKLTSSTGQELALVRQGLARNPLVDAAGAPFDERRLEDMLGGVDRQLYVQMFSVDHDELRTHSEDLLDTGGEIGRLVFGASLGSGSVSDVLHRLESRAAQLYTERGYTQPVMTALKSHREGMKRAREERVRTREWERRLRAVADANAKASELRDALQKARSESSRFDRLQGTLPLVAQRNELAASLRAIEATGVVASRDWEERARNALDRLDKARSQRDTVVVNKEALEKQISEVDVRVDLIEHGAQIDRLVQGVDRYVKDYNDLGERRGQLEGAQKQLGLLLSRLGLQVDDGRLVAEAELTTVESLAQANAALQAELSDAEKELSKLDIAAAAARRQQEELPEPKDIAALSRAVELAKPTVPREAALPAARQELEGLRTDAMARAKRLGLGTSDLSDIEALRIPSAQQIADEQGRREALATRKAQLDKEDADLRTQRGDLEGQIAAIMAKPGVPDPARLRAAREHRDAGWQLVRRALEGGPQEGDAAVAWAGDLPLTSAYERAVIEADAAADDRYDHAQDLTSISQLRLRLVDVAAAEEKAAAARKDLSTEASEVAEAWREMWLPGGVEARDPSEMAAWREEHQQLVSAIVGLRTKEGLLRSEEESIATQVAAVRSAISGLGLTPEAASLWHLVTQAEDIIKEARQQADDRRAAENELKRSTASRPDRDRAVADKKAALDEWEISWATALLPLGLSPDVRPSAALEAVRAYRGLPGARQEVHGFEARIKGIERDLGEFAARVVDVGAGLVPTDGKDPLDVVEELRSSLAVAREKASARDTLNRQLVEAEKALHRAGTDLDARQDDLARLRTELGLAALVELSSVVERSRRAADLKERIADIETNLVARGGGRTVDQVLAEVEALEMDGDELAAALAALGDEISRQDAELGEVNRLLGEATKDLRSVTGESTAADIEQDAQTELASAAHYAAEYARTAMAAAVLRKVISDYGERHRGPILGRASEIFSRLTSGAFTHLVPDVMGGRQILLARRRNDEHLITSQLSDGVRDQLYLALRLAGIEYQLEHLQEPLPVLFDDVLVNFDDERSSAAIDVFAELGEKTQVILFTHHQSVVEAAETVLRSERLGVAQLGARDHSLPLVAVGAAGEPALEPVSRGGDGTEPSVQAVLGVLRLAPSPLSKAEIVASAGIPEELWPQVVRALLDRGLIVQEGQKRGAKYRLPR